MGSEKDSKGFKGAPFGKQAARFDVSGIHPKWKMPGTLLQTTGTNPAMGPGYYNTDQYNEFSQRQVEARSQGPNWKRAHEVELQSRMPHLLYKEQHAERQEQRRKLGPGYYDVTSNESRKDPSGRGLLDTREPRFRTTDERIANPGPGSYGKGGVPHTLKDEADEKRRHCGRVGLLESGAGGRGLPQVGSDVGPGTYNIRGFAEQTIEHKAGKNSRGPYEVFSLDRNAPIKTGHYAKMPAGNLGPGQYEQKDGLAEMSRPEKRGHGKFLRMVQYPSKPCDRIYWMTPATAPPDPTNKVSAVTYHPSDPNFKRKSFSKAKVGFMTNCTRQDKRSLMFFTKNFNQVGPGRYDIQRQDDTAHVNAHTNDFVSKTGARLSQDKQQIYQERLRDKDVPPGRRFRVDHVSTVKEPSVDIQPLLNNRRQLLIQ